MKTRSHSPERAASRSNPSAPNRGSRGICLVAAALAVVAATGACGDIEAPEGDTTGATQLALEELPEIEPVMVTSGTCRSKGFKPIEDAATCSQAGAILIADPVVSGPLDSPPFVSSAHGCSISVTPLGADEAQLSAVYNAGDAQQLKAQTCSHDTPCICVDEPAAEDDVEEATGPCKDGQFTPDPLKYYTIRSPNGRYIRSVHAGPATDRVVLTPIANDATDPYHQPNSGILLDIGVGNDPSDIRLHWRFDGANDEYAPINRSTGTVLISDTLRGEPTFTAGGEGLDTTDAPNPVPMTLSCRGSQVFLEQNGYSPRDTGGLMVDDSDVRDVSLPYVQTEPVSPGFMVRRSGCVKKKRGCTELYGEGFVRTARKKCGALRHHITCEKTLGVPVSMHVPQGWYIEEVTTFSRAVAFDPAPITVDPFVSASSMSDSLATFGISTLDKFGAATAVALAKDVVKGPPLYGAVFSIGMNALFQFGPALGLSAFERPDPVAELGEQFQQALEQLAADITERTAILVANSVVQNDAQSLASRLNERRRRFYDEYPVTRQSRLLLEDPDEVNELAGDVRKEASELLTDVSVIMPLGTPPSNALDALRRAHFGLDIVKLAAMEEMVFLSEAILLEAHAKPGLTCETIVDDRALATRADLLRDELESAVEDLVAYGLANRDNRLNRSADEFEFDARHFSYPVDRQLAYLDTIVAETTAKCHRLRDPADSFREGFEKNELVVD